MAVLPGRAVGSWGHRGQGLARSEGEGRWASLPAPTAAVASQVAHPCPCLWAGAQVSAAPRWGVPCSEAQEARRWTSAPAAATALGLGSGHRPTGREWGVGRAGLGAPRQLSGDVRQDQSQEPGPLWKRLRTWTGGGDTLHQEGGCSPRSPSGVTAAAQRRAHASAQGPWSAIGSQRPPRAPQAERGHVRPQCCLRLPSSAVYTAVTPLRPGLGLRMREAGLGGHSVGATCRGAALSQRTGCVCEARG